MTTFESSSARHQATENLINTTLQHLEESGADADMFAMVDSMVIPNVREGIVSLASGSSNEDSIPVILMSPGESLRYGDGFDQQSPTQAENAQTIIEKWGFDAPTAEELQIGITHSVRSGISTAPPFAMSKDSNGATITMSGVFLPEDVFSEHQPAKPFNSKAIQAMLRPLVVLDPGVHSGVMAHELVHYKSRIDTPVKAISSQRVVDMRGMREELKAYQAGARLSMAIDGKKLKDYSAEELGDNLQLVVEAIRMHANANETDQFITSPELLKSLGSFGLTLDFLMHGRIDVDHIVASLREDS